MRNKSPFVEVESPVSGGAQPSLDRAARLPQFIGGPPDAAAKLRSLRVAVVGTGSVGGRICVHLARLGVAEIRLIDGKSFKPESLLTHEIQPQEIS